MKTYQSIDVKTKRTMYVYPDHVIKTFELLVIDKWERSLRPMDYTQELVKSWGFESLHDYVEFSINRHRYKLIEGNV